MGWAQALCFNKTSRWFLLFWNHWSSFLTGLMQTRHKWPEIPPPRGAGCGSGGPRERLWPFLILISEKMLWETCFWLQRTSCGQRGAFLPEAVIILWLHWKIQLSILLEAATIEWKQ